MTLKSLHSGQKLAGAEEDVALQGKWAQSREHFQVLCQGHSQDVYLVAMGVWGSSLDASALVRQIGKGSCLGENVLTMHSASGFWCIGREAIALSRPLNQVHAETDSFGTWSSGAYRQNWAWPQLLNQGTVTGEGLFHRERRISRSAMLSWVPLVEATGSSSQNEQPVFWRCCTYYLMIPAWRGVWDLEMIPYFLTTLVCPSRKWGQPCSLSASQGCWVNRGNNA